MAELSTDRQIGATTWVRWGIITDENIQGSSSEVMLSPNLTSCKMKLLGQGEECWVVDLRTGNPNSSSALQRTDIPLISRAVEIKVGVIVYL